GRGRRERDGRGDQAAGTEAGTWRRMPAPNRVGEDIPPADLDQERRVTDPGDGDAIGGGTWDGELGHGARQRRRVDVGGARPAPALDAPAQEVCEAHGQCAVRPGIGIPHAARPPRRENYLGGRPSDGHGTVIVASLNLLWLAARI